MSDVLRNALRGLRKSGMSGARRPSRELRIAIGLDSGEEERSEESEPTSVEGVEVESEGVEDEEL